MAVYVSGGVSGALLNPAIGVAFAIIGKLTWIHTFFYAIAQYSGAFVAAALVYGIHYGTPKDSSFLWKTKDINKYLTIRLAYVSTTACLKFLPERAAV